MKYLLALVALIALINVYATQQTVKISPGFWGAPRAPFQATLPSGRMA